MDYDVGIIGGGIAGLSTANEICSSTDASVLLIDKKKVASTETSPMSYPDVVERFGLDEAVLQRYTIFTYMSPTGVAATHKFEKPSFVTIDYNKACDILYNKARKGNLELKISKVIDFDHKSDKKTVEIEFADCEKLNVRILVDASGSALFAPQKLGIHLPPLYSHAYGYVFDDCNIANPEELFIFAGNKYGNGGGWNYPINKRKTCFGFSTVTTSPSYPEKIVAENFEKACKSFNPFNEIIKDAKIVSAKKGTIPIGPLKNFVHGRLMIVGDAAGQATSWYQEGIRPSLSAGELCGKVISKAYLSGNYSKNLEIYQEKWDIENRKMYDVGTRNALHSYFREQKEWNRAVESAKYLTPTEMMERIRYNKQLYNGTFNKILFKLKRSLSFKK